MAKSEQQLIEETREAGRAFLRKTPGAFGGGIDPETGVRISGGRRVSVAGTGETLGVGGVPESLQQAQQIQAEAKRQADAQRKTAQEQRIQEAITFTEKTRIARQIVEQRTVVIEQQRIEAERRRIISAGGRVEQRESIKAGTGERLLITTTRGKRGTRIFEVENLETGRKTIRTFARPKGGGRVRQTGGVIIQKPTEAPVVDTIEDALISEGDPGFIDPLRRQVTFTEPLFGTIQIDPVTGEIITGRRSVPALTRVEKKKMILESLGDVVMAPLFVVGAVGRAAQIGAEALTRKFLPEGIDVELSAKPSKTITFTEPLFGTIQIDPLTGLTLTGERTMTTRAIGPRTVKILEPKAVGEGVGFGLELGVIITAPLLFAPGFIVGGTKKALDKEQAALNRLLGGAEAALGATIVGARAARFLRTPVVKRIPLREVKTPLAAEIQVPIKLGDKQTTVSLFQITGELSAPTIIQRTTRGREILDVIGRETEKIFRVGPRKAPRPVVDLRSPGQVEFKRAREFTIRTPSIVIGEEAFLVAEVRAGSRIIRLGRIAGTERPISLKQFQSLPKTEQFLLQRRAESLTGRKVALKQVPKILSKESRRAASFIESKELFKVRISKREAEFELIPPGRRTRRAIAVTETDKLLAGEGFDLVKAKTLFKDVSLPFTRRAGKTPELDTLLLRLKPVGEKGEGFKVLIPADIKKTPFAKTFAKQDLLVESLASKVILPTVKPAKPSRQILQPPISRTTPAIIGEFGGVTTASRFAGTGQFELTEPQLTTRAPGIQRRGTSLELKSVNIQLLKIIQKQKSGLGQKIIQKQKTVQKQVGLQEIIQKQKPIQLQKSIQAQKPSQISRLLLRGLGIPGIPRTPGKPPTILPPIFGLRRTRLQDRIKEVELFTLEIRREGVFRPIAGDLTLGGALGLGARKTRMTLARTFRLVRTGKKRRIKVDEDFAEPDLTGFRRFKIIGGKKIATPLTFIQEAPLALGTRAERVAIQKARRQSAQLNEILNM